MIVPVLSVHTMSTRARPSMAASSCTSTWRRPRRNTLAVKAMLVSSTSPSGIMLPTPATVPRMASPTESSVDSASWLKMSRMAMGMMSHVTNFRMRSVPRRSSERTNENRLASDASWLAYDSAPMRLARYQPCPAVTKLPDSTSSPGALASGTDSPDSSDSSTSRASAASTSPSATIWVP